jgi:dihydroorotase/N-acyl-D-amino-acid deacylase
MGTSAPVGTTGNEKERASHIPANSSTLSRMPSRRVLLAGCALFAAASLTLQGKQTTPQFDLLLLNGRVVDGTGAPWFRGDVGIAGDRIAAIGQLATSTARVRIDATGLIVAPGFIDMLGQSEISLLVDPRAASKLLQGVTTELTGEGSSAGPVNDRMIADDAPAFARYHLVVDWRTLGEYLTRLNDRAHPALNLGSFVGAGGVRNLVIGRVDRPAAPAELEQMKLEVARAMEQGAFGLSSALQYVPDRFAPTSELVELARVASQHGGIYITHQRSESGRIFESLDEVFTIAEQANIPAEIFHLKTAYRANWGRMPAVLDRIHAARARGLDVTANQYPYTRAANGLDACLPLWVREGTKAQMIARLKDPGQRDRIKQDMADPNATTWENQWVGSGGGDGVLLVSVTNPELRQFEGLTLTEIGRRLNKDPRDAVADLVVEDNAESTVVISIMRDDDVEAALKDSLISVGTDYEARAEDGPMSESKSHPRAWGSFPRILGYYVRERQLLSLEEAVRKMTSRPAARVGLRNRGLLRPGLAADVTVFDPEKIRDVSTYDNPTHYAEGVVDVIVNGQVAVRDGRLTDVHAGRALRGPAYRPN